jgi:hypothetical protein
MPETLTKENWTKLQGENFQVDTGNPDPLMMKLAAVSGYGHRLGGNREAFSLLFCGPLQPVLPQRIYQVAHAGIGSQDIFLVPIGPQAGGMGYEAVFT